MHGARSALRSLGGGGDCGDRGAPTVVASGGRVLACRAGCKTARRRRRRRRARAPPEPYGVDDLALAKSISERKNADFFGATRENQGGGTT